MLYSSIIVDHILEGDFFKYPDFGIIVELVFTVTEKNKNIKKQIVGGKTDKEDIFTF